MMPRMYRLTVLTLLAIMVTILVACGGAAPQISGAPTAGAAATAPDAPETTAPTAAAVPTTAPMPTTAAVTTVPAVTSAPLADTNPAKPDDKTQGRLRLAACLADAPSVDLLVNGAPAVNGGVAQVDMPSTYVNGYLYLAPGTYSIAVVPTGKPVAAALAGPLDIPVIAGHRYTLALTGQVADKSIKPLVIDETAAAHDLR